MFRTLDDYKSKETKADKKTTESYAGGEKSGMAVENPDDILGVINKAKENSEKNKDKPDRENQIQKLGLLYTKMVLLLKEVNSEIITRLRIKNL